MSTAVQNVIPAVGGSMQYKVYCRYARLATRLEQGLVSRELVLREVGIAGLETVTSYLAAGKPTFHACEAAGFSF